jgi:transposase
MGRPRLSLRDTAFACAFKVFSTVSGRRFACDLQDAKAKGFIVDAPHYNSIFRCLESPAMTPILRAMIVESALPLKSVELDFACDSSGFTSRHYVRWIEHKYGKVRQEHTWAKAHICVGVKTNICTAIEIDDKFAADSPMMPALIKQTAQGFTVREMSGDKGYGSLSNYDAIDQVGATPFIAFKSIHTGAGGGLWAKMFHYFNFRRDDFLRSYHKRSNVESTFSMVKRKFGDHVRSKTNTAMKNEVYCKFLCHNICCLIQEMYELGIEPEFWSKPA